MLETSLRAALLASLDHVAVGVDHVVGLDEVLPELGSLLIGHVAVLVERIEDLLLCVEHHVGILLRLQSLIDGCEHQCHDHNEDDRIDDGV